MASAVATRYETPSPSSAPAATQQLEPAKSPSPAQEELYRPDWWGLRIWVVGALILAALHVFDALGRALRWLF
jgi:hypothetical protein